MINTPARPPPTRSTARSPTCRTPPPRRSRSRRRPRPPTVSEMLETHNMLRADTTALFERLREANIMLQEVLSGSHENMSALENTLMLRVSEFVAAMNEVTGSTTARHRAASSSKISNFREITTPCRHRSRPARRAFEAHGRDLGKAAELIDRSNQRTEDAVNERRVSLELAGRHARHPHRGHRTAPQALLRPARRVARGRRHRAREIARLVSEVERRGARAITDQFERVREAAEAERARTVETMRTVYRTPRRKPTACSATPTNASSTRRRHALDLRQSPATLNRCSARPARALPKPCRT